MPEENELTARLKQMVLSIRSKRARALVEHLLKHGSITTEQLTIEYGYKHPPRVARDVREAGIPLETFWIKGNDGRRIAAYRLGDLKNLKVSRVQGRQTFPRELRAQLYNQSEGRCAICNGSFPPRYLQVDHRVPYEITGEPQGNWTQNTLCCCVLRVIGRSHGHVSIVRTGGRGNLQTSA